jgi:hypothetical protein
MGRAAVPSQDRAKASVSSGAQEMPGPDDFEEQGQNAVVSRAFANVP